jgi:hypothetical protein
MLLDSMATLKRHLQKEWNETWLLLFAAS